MSTEVEKLTIAQTRRQQGLCAMCGLVYTGDKYRCKKCSKIRSRNMRRLRNLKRKKGLCPECGKPADNPNLKMCSDCRAKERVRRAKHKLDIGSDKKVKITNELITSVVKKSAKSVDIERKFITKLAEKVQIELELLGLS